MTPCTLCPTPTRPVPGALYCTDCQERRLDEIARRNATPGARAMRRNEDRAWRQAGLPPRPWPTAASGWCDGPPNVTCPACSGSYHYGAPAPFTHMCPLCGAWSCWRETDEIVTKQRRVRKCPRCGGGVTLRGGRYGDFYGCDGYPGCKGIAKGYGIEEYEAPRLRLAVWEPHVWTEMDQRAEDQARLYDRVEGFEAWLAKIRRVRG